MTASDSESSFPDMTDEQLTKLALSIDIEELDIALLDELILRDLCESLALLLERTEDRASVLSSHLGKLTAFAACHSSNGSLQELAAALRAGRGDKADLNSYPPLIYAAMHDNFEGSQILLDAGFDAASADATDGWTSLHWATHNGNAALVQLLLDRGASVDATDLEGRTPSWIAAGEGDDVAIGLLLNHGANPNHIMKLEGESGSLLIHAIRYCRPGVVRALLEVGADPRLEVDGETPWSVAQEYGSPEIDDLLIQAMGSR